MSAWPELRMESDLMGFGVYVHLSEAERGLYFLEREKPTFRDSVRSLGEAFQCGRSGVREMAYEAFITSQGPYQLDPSREFSVRDLEQAAFDIGEKLKQAEALDLQEIRDLRSFLKEVMASIEVA